MSSCNGVRGGKPKCGGLKKNWKKRRWGMEIYPPTFAKRWGIKKIPPSPGPRGPWDKRKKFSRALRARAKIFFRGGMRGDNKKKFFGGIVKTKALATHTLYPPTHTSHPEH